MTQKTIRQLLKRHGKRLEADIRRGVKACRKVWDPESAEPGEFERFCLEQYTPPGAGRNQLLKRLDEFHHVVTGSLGMALKTVRAGQDIADRPSLPAETVLASFSPEAHLQEDYRKSRVAALVQLNFGTDERSAPRTRAAWAARRLGDIGRETIPAELLARYVRAQSEVDRFISSYNLFLDRFDFGDRRVRFPRGTKLVSHWGLRDYMTSLNGTTNALLRQRAILALMRRVVDGEIPSEVLDDESVAWDIPRMRLRASNGRGQPRAATGHGALRWEKFRPVWQASLEIDPYTRYGNVIDNKFLQARELPEQKVVGILTDVLSSPLAERVGRYIADTLGRALEPFDIYYRDFGQGARKERLRYDIRRRYPSALALEEAIPDVLVKLGWRKDRARWIGARIRVDNGRSAGHAWPPALDVDRQLLRVRVDKLGCSEMSFETYMHELGHCVEGVLSSFEMDFHCLWGVPNTAFTEGFAFTFQDCTDQILGRRSRRKGAPAQTLRRFWEPFEIAGSALTEIRFFHWLYRHPDASAAEMQTAIRELGDEVWQEFYARVFGPESHGLLSVYSHILWGDFYLADYPMGFVIAYQVRKYLEDKPLADEVERMCALGRIYPDRWMKAAVGEDISVKPLLDDTRAALDALGY